MITFAAAASDRDARSARIDGVLDQFRHGLQRIGLGKGDDGDCVPIVADAQLPRLKERSCDVGFPDIMARFIEYLKTGRHTRQTETNDSS